MIHDVMRGEQCPRYLEHARGGPSASWLDRRLQTDRLEYLDRDDVDDLKRKVMQSLDRAGRRRWIGIHEKCARMAIREVSDVDCPKILELGAGLGGLSHKLLEMHSTAQVTVTDVDPSFVAAVAAGEIGSHPRATVRQLDATEIDCPGGYYDLAVFALSLHHLPPELAARVRGRDQSGPKVVDRGPAQTAGAVTPRAAGSGATACCHLAVAARRIHQFSTRVQPVGVACVGASRRSRHQRRVPEPARPGADSGRREPSVTARLRTGNPFRITVVTTLRKASRCHHMHRERMIQCATVNYV